MIFYRVSWARLAASLYSRGDWRYVCIVLVENTYKIRVATCIVTQLCEKLGIPLRELS